MKRSNRDEGCDSKRYNMDNVQNVQSVQSVQNAQNASYYSYYNGMMTPQNACYSQMGVMPMVDQSAYAMYTAPAATPWNFAPAQPPMTPIMFDPTQPPPPLPADIKMKKPSSPMPPSPNMSVKPPTPSMPIKSSPSPHQNQPPVSPAGGGTNRRGNMRSNYRPNDKGNMKRNSYSSKNYSSNQQSSISVKTPAKLNSGLHSHGGSSGHNSMGHNHNHNHNHGHNHNHNNHNHNHNSKSYDSMGHNHNSMGHDNHENHNNKPEPHSILINKKAKRKPMSTRYVSKVEWNREDAIKALELEKQYNKLQRTAMLILKFPDPELNKEIVKNYSPYIETVHFQQPSTPRYCFVQLKDGADIEKVRDDLNKITFGTGYIVAEKKNQTCEENQKVSPEEIDPYTLYIGNLPTTITVKTVKEHFPRAHRIDIGYAQRMKYTRYAFIRYTDVDKAMEAYKNTFNMLIESRSLIVRFRRQKSSVGLPGEVKPPNPKRTPQQRSRKEGEEEQHKNSNRSTDEDFSRDVEIISSTLESKEHVLEEAERLMRRPAAVNNHEVIDADRHIKREYPERFDNENDDDDMGLDNGLLGSRVKDEPLDDDELLEQAEFYDMDDDELDCEPEEEDDIIQNEFEHNRHSYGSAERNWEEFRQRALNEKEEKPNVDEFPPFDKKKDKNDRIRLLEQIERTEENRKEDDDLDELFNSMNPEDDDDEY